MVAPGITGSGKQADSATDANRKVRILDCFPASLAVSRKERADINPDQKKLGVGVGVFHIVHFPPPPSRNPSSVPIQLCQEKSKAGSVPTSGSQPKSWVTLGHADLKGASLCSLPFLNAEMHNTRRVCTRAHTPLNKMPVEEMT